MTKLASENATNKANAQGFSLKEGRVAVDGQVAVDPSVKTAVAAPLKAAGNAKTGAGVAVPAPVKANAHADAVKKDERDEDGKHNNKASDDAEGKVEHLAMVDASSAASVGALAPDAGQDAAGAPADTSSDDSDGGVSTPLIIGGVLLLGGGAALAAGGGGKKNVAPTLPATGTATTAEDTAVTVTVTATDPGDTITYTAGSATNGTVTGGANGAFVFTPTKDFNGTGTFTVTATDSKGLTATQTVTVTVTAVNDTPVAVADTATATEDGAVVTGNVSTNDTDVDTGDTKTYSLNAPVAGLTLNANGTYSFDPTNAAYQNIAAGATRAVVANYTLTDSKGATSTSTLTITVTGVNDAPVGVAATNAATEDGATVTGQLAATDADTGAALTYAIQGTAPAGLTLNANGSYSFNPVNAAYQDLGAGATRNVVATYVVTDDKGATATSTITVVVTGANDAPVAVAASKTATEDGAVVTGQLAATDVDAGDTLTYTLNAPVAGLTLNANGSYSFDPASYDSIGAGVVQNVVANYTVSDGKGGTSTSTITFAVTGINDAPVGVAAANTAVEDGAVVTGQLAATDVDVGDTLTYTLNAPVAGLTLNANGSYSFDPASYDSIAAGATQIVVANYTVSDGKGGTATSTLSIAVTGVNDAPVAVNDVAAVTEGASVSGSVATNDSDVDNGAVLTYSIVGAATPGVTFNPNGSYIFNAADAAYDNLGAGETRVVNVNYSVSDGTASSNATLAVTVTGVNDAPVAVARTAAAIEDGAVVTGQLAATDVDANDTLTYSLNAPVVGLTINPNGTYSFDPASYDSLAAGATQNVVANYTVSDGKGGTSSSTLTITVTGINDAPVAVNDTAAVTEGASISGSVATNDSDVDNGAVLTYSVVGAAPGGLTLNNDGSYVFNAADAAYDNLAGGETRVVNVNYAVSDGTASSNATLAVTVTGVNDAPVITTGATATVNENALTTTVVYDAAATDVDAGQQATLVYTLGGVDAGLFNINAVTGEVRLNASANFEAAKNTYDFTVIVTDVQGGTDSQDVHVTVNNLVDILPIDLVGPGGTQVVIDASGNDAADVTDVNYQFNESAGTESDVILQNFTSNDYILFSTPLTGYNYTNTNGDLVITQNNGGVVSRIVIEDVLNPNLLLANSESAAETALNNAFGTTNVDYLRGSNLPAVTRSADVDNDNNAGTPATSVELPGLDASGAAVTYTENANAGNTVVISNFTSDDKIVVTGAASGDYNFVVAPGGLDLVITYTSGASVVSSITLDDFFTTKFESFPVNEQTIEAAVGFDFFSYA